MNKNENLIRVKGSTQHNSTAVTPSYPLHTFACTLSIQRHIDREQNGISKDFQNRLLFFFLFFSLFFTLRRLTMCSSFSFLILHSILVSLLFFSSLIFSIFILFFLYLSFSFFLFAFFSLIIYFSISFFHFLSLFSFFLALHYFSLVFIIL